MTAQTIAADQVSYQVEYSYEATTLDYLSPRWYPMGEPTADADAADLLCEVQRERHAEAGGEPCMFRVRTIPSQVQRDEYLEAEFAANARYWADRAAESRRMEEARKALFALKGQQVVVVKGRKVPLGTTGECFWIGEDKYSRTGGYRVGLKDAEGTVHWTSASNIEAVEG